MTTFDADSTQPAPVPGLLPGKVVLVTGASRGIGRAAARLFAAEGARVVLAARSLAALEGVVEEIRGSGGSADAVPIDLTRPASIRAASSGSRSCTDGSTAPSTTPAWCSGLVRRRPPATRTSRSSSP